MLKKYVKHQNWCEGVGLTNGNCLAIFQIILVIVNIYIFIFLINNWGYSNVEDFTTEHSIILYL